MSRFHPKNVQLLWKSLLVSPIVLGATLVVPPSTMAVPTRTTASVLQPQAVETKALDANSVEIAYATAKPNAGIPEAPDSVAVPGFSTAITESEQPKFANIDTSTQAVVKPATEPEEPTLAEKEISTQVVVTTSSQIVADKLEAAVAQLTVTPAATPATPAASSPAPASPNSLDQVNSYSNEGKDNNMLAQVTSVSQLSDVQPTDWAFQALQSLVERYGVIAGYPDGTYRGNQAMTRYEFAAALNAALDRVNELIATSTADLIRREDLATLQRLQEEFAAELATLRGRADALEAVTTELEVNQFSTTTKVVGEVVAVVTDAFGDDVKDDNNTVFQDRARLDFLTSFTGSDVLHTRLNAGNADFFNIPGSPSEGFQIINSGNTGGNDVIVDWLAYYFPLSMNLQAYIDIVGGAYIDFVPSLNPYFEDYDGGNGALSTFAQSSSIYRIGGGQGGGVNLTFGESGILGASTLSLGYYAARGNDPIEDGGLINGDYSALAQLSFNFNDRFAIAATYVHGYHDAGNPIFSWGSVQSDFEPVDPRLGVGFALTGTAAANLPSATGVVASTPLVTNSYGIEAAFRLSDRISISGWAAYTDVTLLGRGDGEIWTYALGVAFPDLGKEGNVLGLFAGVEPTLRSLDVPGDPDFANDYGYHIEGFYKYRLTDNISITPGFIWLTAPGQSEDNSDVIIGTLRTTFSF